jgi:2-methylfumaryl-CoA hydratase
MTKPKIFQYGRLLSDFEVGETYPHPWEVTVDASMLALFQGSFLDATPTYASSHFAESLGFRGRPIHPLLLLNLGLSFSVHDVSEQAIAHLAYIDVKFPNACYLGDTLHASSKVLSAKPSSKGDKGVVHVRTILENQDGLWVCTFERKALIRAGSLEERPETPFSYEQVEATNIPDRPDIFRGSFPRPQRKVGFAGYFEDFNEGDVFSHYNGKTIGESEHMQLTLMMRNSHPLHFDEKYCEAGASFTGTRVVYGGLVFGFVASLASRDLCGNVIWDLGFDDGAHPSGVIGGDTIYAASKVLKKKIISDEAGEVTFRLVGVKNNRPENLMESGHDLFTAEREKEKENRTPSKVFEITRRVLMLRKP